tara:strand:+ start:755 stop:898 length:144 start_codon:yes stop_codon:yes gene_type:complete
MWGRLLVVNMVSVYLPISLYVSDGMVEKVKLGVVFGLQDFFQKLFIA